MIKKKTVMILFVAMLLSQVLILQPSLSKAPINRRKNQTINSIEQPFAGKLTPDAPPGTEVIKNNVIYNGEFEENDIYGNPSGFWSYGTGYSNINYSYQDEVHAGTYGAYILVKGSTQSSGYVYAYRSVSTYTDTALDEDLNLDFWFNVKASPDYTRNADMRINMYFTNNYVEYYYLYYVLSRQTFTWSNSTNYAYYDVRTATTDTWVHFSRNITDDFIQGMGTLPDLSLMCLYHLEFYCSSPSNPTGDTIMLADDVSLTNGSAYNYFSDNGDFEDGDEIPWGKSTYGYGTALLTQSDKIQGNSALNITTSTKHTYQYSYAECGKDLFTDYDSVPKGYIAYQPGDIELNFNWKYTDLDNGLGDINAYFYFNARNETDRTTIYYYLGNENDNIPYSNDSIAPRTRYRFEAPNFGTRDTWNYLSIDIYTLLNDLNLKNHIMQDCGFYLSAGSGDDLTAQLLVDDFRLITHPTGDPGFEFDIGYTAVDPIRLWETPNNPNYVNVTTDAHTGNYAANLTSNSGVVSAYCFRYMYSQVESNQFTDFWWRLDKMTDDGNQAFTAIVIEIDVSNNIYYVLGNNSNYNPTNTSGYCFYFVEGNNVIGIWQNLFRNLTNDIISAFGPGNHNMTYISLEAYTTGTEETTLIVDDLNFVRDIEGPIISSLEQSPIDPEYGQAVEVSVDVSDNIMLHWVEVVYQIGAGPWTPTPMNFVSGKYRATLPSADYDTNVNYYFVASDAYNQVTELGSVGSPYTYTVGDFTDPVLFIEAPPESQILNGSITFNITDAYDLGSGVALFTIILNDTIVYSNPAIPSNYTWDTEVFGNQNYTIIFSMEDVAGNYIEEVYVYNVYNPPTGWETFKAFMQKWYPYISAGAGALLIGILVIVIVVRRKKKIA